MDAYSVNHNGTTLISDASNPPFQYITFPAGRYSEYVMYLPIDDIGDTVQLVHRAYHDPFQRHQGGGQGQL